MEEEGRFLQRVRGAIELDEEIYAEIDADPAAIPQAFVVLLAAATLASVSVSPFVLFSSMAGLLFAWLVAAALVWAVGSLLTRRDVDYARLLRCLGFGYIWIAPLVLSGLPFWIGQVITALTLLPLFGSFWLATRQVIGVDSREASIICGTALVIPFLLVCAVS